MCHWWARRFDAFPQWNIVAHQRFRALDFFARMCITFATVDEGGGTLFVQLRFSIIPDAKFSEGGQSALALLSTELQIDLLRTSVRRWQSLTTREKKVLPKCERS